MSCWQLHLHQKNDIKALRNHHPLEALDTGVLDYRKRGWVSTEKKAYIADTYAVRPNFRTF